LTEVGVPLERRFRSLWFDADVIVQARRIRCLQPR